MKKPLALLTALLLALLLCACGTATEEDVEKTEGSVSPTDLEEVQQDVFSPPPPKNGIGVYESGVGGLYLIAPGEPYELINHINLEGLAFPEIQEADIPVFANPYPSGMGGPMYNVTDQMLAEMEQRLTDFLELLYGEWDAERYPFQYEENNYHSYDPEENKEEHFTTEVIRVELDGLRICSQASGLSVSLASGWEDIARLLADGDLRQSPLLAAILDYMAIDDPQVECRVRYNSLNGQPVEYEYYIYQQADHSRQNTLNRSFNSVDVYFSSYWDHFSIYFDKQEHQPVSAELPAVSLDQAMEMVREIFPELEREDIKVRLGYQMYIREEYLIPCWELYVPNGCWGSDGVRLYTPMWVPTLDPATLE